MTNSLELHPQGGPPSPIRCEVSDGFPSWLSQANGAIVLTTYQAGKVAMIGWDGRQVTLLFRDFEKPMGMDTLGSRMLLATRRQVIELASAPLLAHEYLEGQPGRYDALYLPRVSYYTGDVNVHDVAYGAECLWLVNTRFSCLASPSHEFSFVPRWRPPFISQTVPEDRCHLNGLAMEAGRPRFVTALGESDVVGGWREKKATGGIVIDVLSNAIVVRGLSMPHSPRLHNGALWVLNSGAAELWRVDLGSFRHDVVCQLPGYLRGLCFVGPVRFGRAQHDSREAYLWRLAPAAEVPQAAVWRGGRRHPHRPPDRVLRIHGGLHRAVRRAVPAKCFPADDPECGKRGVSPSPDRAGILVLVATQRTSPGVEPTAVQKAVIQRISCRRTGKSGYKASSAFGDRFAANRLRLVSATALMSGSRRDRFWKELMMFSLPWSWRRKQDPSRRGAGNAFSSNVWRIGCNRASSRQAPPTKKSTSPRR